MPNFPFQTSLQQFSCFGTHQKLPILLLPLLSRGFYPLVFSLNFIVESFSSATSGRKSRCEVTITHVSVEETEIAIRVGGQTVHVDQLSSFQLDEEGKTGS